MQSEEALLQQFLDAAVISNLNTIYLADQLNMCLTNRQKLL